MTTTGISLSDKGFLRLAQILELIPISEASWWNGCREGIYPRSYKLSPRVTAWRKVDILNLIDSFK